MDVHHLPERGFHITPVVGQISPVVRASPAQDRAFAKLRAVHARGIMTAARAFQTFQKCPLSGHALKLLVPVLAMHLLAIFSNSDSQMTYRQPR
jgi:hypothetical protein